MLRTFSEIILSQLNSTPDSDSWLRLLTPTPDSDSWLGLLTRTPDSDSWLWLLTPTSAFGTVSVLKVCVVGWWVCKPKWICLSHPFIYFQRTILQLAEIEGLGPAAQTKSNGEGSGEFRLGEDAKKRGGGGQSKLILISQKMVSFNVTLWIMSYFIYLPSESRPVRYIFKNSQPWMALRLVYNIRNIFHLHIVHQKWIIKKSFNKKTFYKYT